MFFKITLISLTGHEIRICLSQIASSSVVIMEIVSAL